ncbi:MAG: aspartate 1-decarboxylase [Betaproteobacteria bacterium]|nr:aspartate 1-decarboxylase [Betaproteobacteria bacterium]
MFRTFLNGKIHRATVSHCELHYEGSCAIDADLLDASGIAPNEQIDIYNVTNGQRFTTYALLAPRGSRMISVNGAAARLAAVGDIVIIAAYVQVGNDEVDSHQPKVVFVDSYNDIVEKRKEVQPD